MPSRESMIARRFIRATLRSPDKDIRSIARMIAKRAGADTPDRTYNLADAAALATADRIAVAIRDRSPKT